jgi:putative endonuclease
MAYVYILYSTQVDKFYIGSCKDLDERLLFHLNKKFKEAYTRMSNDWEIYFHISVHYYTHARSIELHIKQMKSRKYIENLKTFPEMVERL